MEYSNLEEKQLRSTELYKGKILDLYRDDVRLPNGEAAVREYIKHIGAVCVVALTDDMRVICERQFRYPFGEVLREIPAGKLDSRSEKPESAALRELKEETGVTAGRLRFIGKFYPTCAYSDEVIYMFLAQELSFGERALDDDEFLDVEAVPIENLVQDILDGKIKDGKTQAAVLKAYVLLKSE